MRVQAITKNRHRYKMYESDTSMYLAFMAYPTIAVTAITMRNGVIWPAV
jgi:hypothetical protein